MDIKVGIQHINREIVIDSAESSDSIEKAFAKAKSNGGLLTLIDQRGRRVLIPADTIAYLDLGEENARHVGFSV